MFDLDDALRRAAQTQAKDRESARDWWDLADTLAEDVEILVRMVRRLSTNKWNDVQMQVALRLARQGQTDEQITDTLGSVGAPPQVTTEEMAEVWREHFQGIVASGSESWTPQQISEYVDQMVAFVVDDPAINKVNEVLRRKYASHDSEVKSHVPGSSAES